MELAWYKTPQITSTRPPLISQLPNKTPNQIIIKADQNKLGKGGLKHQVVLKSNEILHKSSQYKQYALQKTSVF